MLNIFYQNSSNITPSFLQKNDDELPKYETDYLAKCMGTFQFLL